MNPDEVTEIKAELDGFVEDLFASLPRADQRSKGNLYLRGLILDGPASCPLGWRLFVPEAWDDTCAESNDAAATIQVSSPARGQRPAAPDLRRRHRGNQPVWVLTGALPPGGGLDGPRRRRHPVAHRHPAGRADSPGRPFQARPLPRSGEEQRPVRHPQRRDQPQTPPDLELTLQNGPGRSVGPGKPWHHTATPTPAPSAQAKTGRTSITSAKIGRNTRSHASVPVSATQRDRHDDVFSSLLDIPVLPSEPRCVPAVACFPAVDMHRRGHVVLQTVRLSESSRARSASYGPFVRGLPHMESRS
jgi:hypothetical protein